MRTCIICGQPAGSREHLLPAALGGRRVNKGIYCADHNAAFAPLAATLADQLRALNAFLMVVNDHSSAPAALGLTLPDGAVVALSGTDATLRPTFVTETETEEVWRGTARFRSEADGMAWVAAQRAQGKRVEVGEARREPPKFYEGRPIEITFGGPEGLRAAAYVALTYFAHHFPDAARDPALEPLKAHVADGATSLASWADPAVIQRFPENPFPFGHMIAVGIDQTEEARALVSLFGCFAIGINIGRLAVAAPLAIVTYVDPLAAHPPNDIVETAIDPSAIVRVAPERSDDVLNEIVAVDGFRSGFDLFNKRLNTHQCRRDAARLLPAIQELGEASADERIAAIDAYLCSLDPMTSILRMTDMIVRHLKERLALAPDTATVIPLVEELFAFDPARPGGLSQNLETLLPALADQIRHELLIALDDQDITLDRIADIFGGDRGLARLQDTIVATLNQVIAALSPAAPP